MLVKDIIYQLWAQLPRRSTKYTNTIAISSISRTASAVTVTTATAHGLLAGNGVNIVGVYIPCEIDTVTDNGDGTLTITTLSDHDLTYNAREHITVAARITGGAFDEEFNVIGVANRRTFTIDTGTATPDAGDFLQETFISGYNGLKPVVAVPTATTFTYAISGTPSNPNNVTDAVVSARHRISGAISYELARSAYTAQTADTKYWLFVVPEATIPSKDRQGVNDANVQRGRQSDFFHQIIEGFTLYLFVPNKGATPAAVSGIIARDNAINERLPILQSVLGKQFSSDLESQGSGLSTYNGDGLWEYTGAYYVHAFNFQQVANITNQDTSIESDDHAFRDINFGITGLGVDSVDHTSPDYILGYADLDDEPL